MAQMESRNADRGLWKWKLKITEQLKENKQGFIRNNCLKRKKKHFQLKMKGHKNKSDENHCKENQKKEERTQSCRKWVKKQKSKIN